MTAALARWWLLVLGLLACGLAAAQAPVPVPSLTARVTDLTGTLTAPQAAALEEKLAAFEARKGSQLAVLIVPTTAPETIEAYALRVAEQWKLGRRKVDDAALLVVARNDRAVRIEVGYGLEGVLTDASARRIIDETMVPRFAQQDYAGGITAGVEQMMGVIDGEPLPAPPVDESYPIMSLPALVGAALVLGAVLRMVLGRLAGSAATGALIGVAAWWLQGGLGVAVAAGFVALLVSLLGSLGFFPFGGSGPGGGRRDKSSGGGFHGGGGGFGGGGASGRW